MTRFRNARRVSTFRDTMMIIRVFLLISFYFGLVSARPHVRPSPVTRSKPVPTNHQALVVAKRKTRYQAQLTAIRMLFLYLCIYRNVLLQS